MINMNPLQLIGLLKSGGSPQEFALSLIKSNNINDPMINQLVQLAEQGDTANINKIAEDFFSSRGKNFTDEFNSFMSLFK